MNVSAARLVEEFGFTERHWIRMAAAGRVPGARQPFGPRSRWVFDLTAVRRWWEASLRTATAWPTATPVGKRGSGVSRGMAKTFANPSRRDLKASRSAVLEALSPNSKRGRGAPSRS